MYHISRYNPSFRLETERNLERPQSGQPVARLIFELGTSPISVGRYRYTNQLSVCELSFGQVWDIRNKMCLIKLLPPKWKTYFQAVQSVFTKEALATESWWRNH